MEQQVIENWARKDLWSEGELGALCCGLEPNAARSSTEDLNNAAEAIRRAVLNKTLACVCPTDATAGDKLYGHARFFRPADAIQWAASKFPNLPKFPVTDPLPARWPWGDYETKLLQKLAEAADRFWKLYDPADNTTAPTNQHVVEWLKSEKVAARTAEIMAQILRADGLPPGPRK